MKAFVELWPGTSIAPETIVGIKLLPPCEGCQERVVVHCSGSGVHILEPATPEDYARLRDLAINSVSARNKTSDAAFDLLEAVKLAKLTLENAYSDGFIAQFERDPAVEVCRAAIAKAEGTQNPTPASEAEQRERQTKENDVEGRS